MRYQKQAISEIDFKKFREGDNLAFKVVFDAYHKVLFRYVSAFTGEEGEAEELVQEAFVNLFSHRRNVTNPEGIYPFLFTTIKRLAISNFRKRIVRAKYKNYLALHWKEDCRQTENQLKASELNVLLSDAIDELPERQKEIYTLNKLEDLSYQDIADELGLSKNTVRNHLIAASRTIREKIEKAY